MEAQLRLQKQGGGGVRYSSPGSRKGAVRLTLTLVFLFWPLAIKEPAGGIIEGIWLFIVVIAVVAIKQAGKDKKTGNSTATAAVATGTSTLANSTPAPITQRPTVKTPASSPPSIIQRMPAAPVVRRDVKTPIAPAVHIGVADEIAKLGQLRAQGFITDAEFKAQKLKLLGRP
jgi:hypothetical protein